MVDLNTDGLNEKHGLVCTMLSRVTRARSLAIVRPFPDKEIQPDLNEEFLQTQRDMEDASQRNIQLALQ